MMKKFVSIINGLSETYLGTFIIVTICICIMTIIFSIAMNISNNDYKIIKVDDNHYLYINNQQGSNPEVITIEPTKN